ncbi:MAG: hypothetical protein LBB10_02450 [Bifidobacteriaceae bacterium]|jgi:uncharacterized membrane-anchored protein|nr:hypothetical protein [Bifidobacteriaceae bacterium]
MFKLFKLLADSFTKRAETNDDDPKLQKIGGFLLFVAIIFFVRGISAVMTFFSFNDWLSSGDDCVIVSNIISFLAGIVGVLSAYFIYRRFRSGMLFAQINVSLQVLASVFLLFVSDSYKLEFSKRLLQTSSDKTIQLDPLQFYSISSIMGLVISVIFAVVIILYFRKSRRVANTLAL